jgi:hypothetical protein
MSGTVIFWGAGATAALGMRITAAQGQFISTLTGPDTEAEDISLTNRVSLALADSNETHWHNTLFDLLTILGDGKESSQTIHLVDKEHLDAMSRHWTPGATEDELRSRIMAMRLIYDWPALKDVVRICPGVRSDKFKINDLFNLMDTHIPLGHGFRTDEGRFLDQRRLLGAKTALKMLIHAMVYIDYQVCLLKKSDILRKYYEFGLALGRRTQNAGRRYSEGFDRATFIRDDISFVSLNYDPILLWTQFVANRDLNNNPSVPHVGSPSRSLQVFHDMGHFIPSRRVEPNGRPALWYPMNEASAQRLNEDGSGASQRIRVRKFLFPHGCFCWRECPDCGKLSAYHGDEWDTASSSLIPPPPLKGFEQRGAYPNLAKFNDSDSEWRKDEKSKWEEGRVDARACLHCQTLTSAHHTQTVMQSSFKQPPPSFIDEIQRDLRALVMQADHIIFMGYSLPQDDVSYRSFFAARRQRQKTDKPPVRCSIVGYDRGHPGWTGPSALKGQPFSADSPVHGALELFGEGNVRYYGDGVPAVFLDDAGNVSAQQIEELFTWPTG